MRHSDIAEKMVTLIWQWWIANRAMVGDCHNFGGTFSDGAAYVITVCIRMADSAGVY